MSFWNKLGREIAKPGSWDREIAERTKEASGVPAVAQPKATNDVAKLVPIERSDHELDKERRALELSEIRKQRALNERDIAWAECSKFISESRLRSEKDPDYSGV